MDSNKKKKTGKSAKKSKKSPPTAAPTLPPTLPPQGNSATGMDLGIRFNKIDFYEDANPPLGIDLTPLSARTFPLSEGTASWLRQTRAISVIRDQDCHECSIETVELIAEVGGLPSYPTDNPDDPFWDELLEVVRVQQGRRMGVVPTTYMRLPTIWEDYDIHKVAEAVHDEVRPNTKPSFFADMDLTLTYVFFLHCGCKTVSWCSSH